MQPAHRKCFMAPAVMKHFLRVLQNSLIVNCNKLFYCRAYPVKLAYKHEQ